MKDLTLRVRQARRKAGLSQTALAERLGVNRSAVAQWERAGGTRPNAENLSRLAVEAQVSYEWLATGRGRMNGSEARHEEQVVLLNHYAQEELEERLLVSVRRLESWQKRVVLELVEGLSKRGAGGPRKRLRKSPGEDED